ncbi:hypothetical protein Poly41_24410 [Novipirellula artificiosorum]|uniref:Uncharacterized protein n=1 Tax=Novipirellula artificiosorum TaxID=2528016 RepID=A0A5C6DX41_9BACT|nr:hypothetical protein Poly41_24410 [Novipirellula artificiosorum]
MGAVALGLLGQKTGSFDRSARNPDSRFFGGMAPVSNDLLEKSPRRSVVRREPVAPLAYRRPGYPLSSCTSAELDSVSTGNCAITSENSSCQQ